MKKLLMLAPMLFLFSSCESQIGTAVGAAFTNLFTGSGFQDSSSDQLYEEMKNAKISPSNSTSSEKTTCLSEDTFILPVKNMSAMNKIKDHLCSCETWGACDKNSCSCEVLCPNNFDILKMNNHKNDDSEENSLSFTNQDIDFHKKYYDYSGFCWGHALITQRFNRLVRFNPKLPKKFAEDDQSSERLREYKDIIAKLDNNEPVDIPGFKNLHEFSSDPEVRDLLEEAAKKNWAENAMSTQGLSIIASGEPQGADYYHKLFDDLEFRLKNNQSPAIVFNARDKSTKVHTVLVNGSGTTPKGERFICIRDNNFSPARSLDCENKLILSKEGTISYSKWKKLPDIGQVKLSYSENSNLLEQISNLHTKCLTEKDCDATKANPLSQ
ncbi:MAG: hypothetical protein PHY93_05280 [Bacteriovorax sp.]|nr:hypothetical protein [Bacteriovorax sp.]